MGRITRAVHAVFAELGVGFAGRTVAEVQRRVEARLGAPLDPRHEQRFMKALQRKIAETYAPPPPGGGCAAATAAKSKGEM